MNPDCRDGKHQACAGDGWDEVLDEPSDCQCACHDIKEPEMADKIPVTWEGLVVGEAEVREDGTAIIELDAKMNPWVEQNGLSGLSIRDED